VSVLTCAHLLLPLATVANIDPTNMYERKEYPVTGSPDYNSLSAKQVDSNAMITLSRLKGANLTCSQRRVVCGQPMAAG
jgi:hypothetical protein